MKIDLDDRQKELRSAVRDFATREIAPRAAEMDRSRQFPRDILKKAAPLGLLGLGVPADLQGAGHDTVGFTVAIEEIARQCASTALVVSAHNALVCDPILDWGTAEQKQRYLRPLAAGEKIGAYAYAEPAGSDPGAFRTTARRDGDHYVLDGTKSYVTSASDADLFLVYATHDPAAGAAAISAFLVDRGTPGLSVTPEAEMLGVRATGIGQVRLEGCRVTAGQRLGEEGKGVEISSRALDGGRIGIAAQSVGIARAALEEALRYSQERKSGGKPLSYLQAIQFQLADMAMEIDAARLLTWKAAWARDTARARGMDRRWTLEASTAKLFASETANRCANRALQIHGGFGYTKECPVERMYRDARITEIDQGTSEIQRVVIAARILQGAE